MNRREALKAALALPLVGLVPAVSKPNPTYPFAVGDTLGVLTLGGERQAVIVTDVQLRNGAFFLKTRQVALALKRPSSSYASPSPSKLTWDSPESPR